MPNDIIFVLGPSGVGKSHLSKALALKLEYEFYEIDQYPADGIDVHDLRREWNELWLFARPDALVELLRRRAQAAGKTGIVLSFPSMLILKWPHLGALSRKVRVVYLTGTAKECRDAFLAREQQSGRGLDVTHWVGNNNRSMFEFLESDEATNYAVAAFAGTGLRRDTERVLAEMAGERR